MTLIQSKYYKIRTAVPVDAAKKVREAIHMAGAGKQGNYEYCSGSHRQIGRFRPVAGASPAIGKIGELKEVEEELIEVLCHEDLIPKVVSALRSAHPYEEPAIDIIPRMELGNEENG